MDCYHCKQDISGNPEFCPACGKILPVPEGRSHYQVLGYDRVIMNLDSADLERRFFHLSKKFHPDRFAGKTPVELQFSHDHSSAINNAYRTLKNPVTRARFLVERELGSIVEKSSSVPADTADLFFEMHDTLDVIRESNGNPPQDAVNQVKAAEADLRRKATVLEEDLQRSFPVYDEQGGKDLVEAMKEKLSHRSYILSFLRQIDSALGRDL